MASKCSIKGLLEPPSPAQLKIILANINEESEEKLLHNERLLDEWIKCQNHFPKNIDPGYIRGILRESKHMLEKAKQKLEYSLAARHLYPEFYENRSPFSKDVLHIMDVLNIAVMPKLTSEGYRVCFITLNRYEVSDFIVPNCIKLFLMIYDLILSSNNVAAGDVFIIDDEHMTVGHITTFFGPILKKFLALVVRMYPLRIKMVHSINAPTIAGKMASIMKPLLPAKLGGRIYVHDKFGGVLEQFDPDVRPSNYGGNLKSVREIALDWYDILKANSDWFESQENVKITEVPKKIKTSFELGDQLGIDGSFRKLEVD